MHNLFFSKHWFISDTRSLRLPYLYFCFQNFNKTLKFQVFFSSWFPPMQNTGLKSIQIEFLFIFIFWNLNSFILIDFSFSCGNRLVTLKKFRNLEELVWLILVHGIGDKLLSNSESQKFVNFLQKKNIYVNRLEIINFSL